MWGKPLNKLAASLDCGVTTKWKQMCGKRNACVYVLMLFATTRRIGFWEKGTIRIQVLTNFPFE